MCEDFSVMASYDGYNKESLNMLNRSIFNKCQDYYASKVAKGILKKDAKIIIDRTFNLYDSFARMVTKSRDPFIKILSNIFKQGLFKDIFMKDEILFEFYNNL